MARPALPFVLRLQIDGRPGTLSRRLSAALVDAIADGQLTDGDALPSTRSVAAHLSMARSVVVEAYDELIAAGFLRARPGSRTEVGPGAATASRAGAFGAVAQPGSPPHQPPIASVATRFDLTPGHPDTSLINAGDWNRSWRRAAGQVLQAPDRQTHRELSDQVADHLRHNRGVVVDPRNVLIFPRVNTAIRVVGRALLDPARPVAFEDPGYPTGRRAFSDAGLSVRAVPVDEEGLIVDTLGARDGAVYVTPAHQYPLGSRLSVARRSALLEWSVAADALVFEDDYDGEFRYDVAPMPALRAMPAGKDRVVYLGTTSKILRRDLRVAWAVVPDDSRDLIDVLRRDDEDLVSAVAAAAVSEFIRTGALRRQLTTGHRVYAARRSRFAAACAALLPEARLHGVEAGLHVVLTFDRLDGGVTSRDIRSPTIVFDDVAATAALRDHGIACAPLSTYYRRPTEPTRTGLVCGYAQLAETRCTELVSLLRAVLVPGFVPPH